MWPLRRREPGSVQTADAPAPVARTARHETWSALPPLATHAQRMAMTVDHDRFRSGLAVWTSPDRFLGDLGHQIDPAGPGGVIAARSHSAGPSMTADGPLRAGLRLQRRAKDRRVVAAGATWDVAGPHAAPTTASPGATAPTPTSADDRLVPIQRAAGHEVPARDPDDGDAGDGDAGDGDAGSDIVIDPVLGHAEAAFPLTVHHLPASDLPATPAAVAGRLPTVARRSLSSASPTGQRAASDPGGTGGPGLETSATLGAEPLTAAPPTGAPEDPPIAAAIAGLTSAAVDAAPPLVPVTTPSSPRRRGLGAPLTAVQAVSPTNPLAGHSPAASSATPAAARGASASVQRTARDDLPALQSSANGAPGLGHAAAPHAPVTDAARPLEPDRGIPPITPSVGETPPPTPTALPADDLAGAADTVAPLLAASVGPYGAPSLSAEDPTPAAMPTTTAGPDPVRVARRAAGDVGAGRPATAVTAPTLPIAVSRLARPMADGAPFLVPPSPGAPELPLQRTLGRDAIRTGLPSVAHHTGHAEFEARDRSAGAVDGPVAASPTDPAPVTHPGSDEEGLAPFVAPVPSRRLSVARLASPLAALDPGRPSAVPPGRLQPPADDPAVASSGEPAPVGPSLASPVLQRVQDRVATLVSAGQATVADDGGVVFQRAEATPFASPALTDPEAGVTSGDVTPTISATSTASPRLPLPASDAAGLERLVVHSIYPMIRRRLVAELRLDRERAGIAADRRR